MSKIINFSIDETYDLKFRKIAELSKRKNSDLFRILIDYFLDHPERLEEALNVKIDMEQVSEELDAVAEPIDDDDGFF